MPKLNKRDLGWGLDRGKKVKLEVAKCAGCGNEFNKRRDWQKFCTYGCRMRYHSEEREKALRAWKDQNRS